MNRLTALLLLFLVAACTQANQTEEAYVEVATAVPTLDDAILADAQTYAEDMGIPVAEAVERLQWQSREEVGNLNAALEANERDTFAGLWFQHEPTFNVVVAFTENGEETIAKYVAADSELAQLIQLRQMPYTYAQLRSDQQSAQQILQEANFPASSGVNVMENQVELYITDQAAFEAALEEVAGVLPEMWLSRPYTNP